jgi:hypothetical protein
MLPCRSTAKGFGSRRGAFGEANHHFCIELFIFALISNYSDWERAGNQESRLGEE